MTNFDAWRSPVIRLSVVSQILSELLGMWHFTGQTVFIGDHVLWATISTGSISNLVRLSLSLSRPLPHALPSSVDLSFKIFRGDRIVKSVQSDARPSGVMIRHDTRASPLSYSCKCSHNLLMTSDGSKPEMILAWWEEKLSLIGVPDPVTICHATQTVHQNLQGKTNEKNKHPGTMTKTTTTTTGTLISWCYFQKYLFSQFPKWTLNYNYGKRALK